MAPVPVVHDLKVEGDETYMTAAALVHNGGKRKGAVCAYLETWHVDIEEFLDLRKNTGDDRRRTHDMNTANWVPGPVHEAGGGGRRLDAVLARRDPGPPRPDGPGLRGRLHRLRGPRRARRAEGQQAHQGGGPVAQDARHAVRDRPPLDRLQGPLQPALHQPACRRSAQL